MAILRKTDIASVDEAVEKLETSYIAGENIKWYINFRQQLDSVLKS